jgi:hypothetical protein
MKRTLILLPVVLLAVFSSCKKSFDDLYINNNKPTAVPASLLFNTVLNSMVDAPGGQSDKTNQFQEWNNSYFGNNLYTFGPGDNYYTQLTNVVNMENAAKSLGEPNPYHALGKFFRAYFFTKMSLEMGDIPMTQALNGAAELQPAYDAQSTIFKTSLAWLDSANTDLAALIAKGNKSLSGDMYFSNSLTQWQKVVNALHVRLLIHLSKKVGADPELDIPGQFAKILGDPTTYPLMTGMGDNLQYVWLNPTNRYPLNKETFANGAYINSASTYVGLLTSLKDPRVFVTTDPAPGIVSKGGSPVDFSSFQGGDIGASMDVLSTQNGGGILSSINRWRYYSGYTGENTFIIGYIEMCFNIAEGINRGWATAGALGDAEAYYKAGINASMAFYGVPTAGAMIAYSLPAGVPIAGPYVQTPVNVDLSAYYAQTSVQYAGNNATGLTQILQQKYIAFYCNSGLEAYFNWRRTGVPTFSAGPGNGNNSQIALRYKYFAAEQSSNTKNYNAAIAQYNGVDDINGVMWILK